MRLLGSNHLSQKPRLHGKLDRCLLAPLSWLRTHLKRQGQVRQSQLDRNVAMIAPQASFDTLSTAKA